MPRLIATDGSGVVNGKDKTPVRPVKPRYPVSAVSNHPVNYYPVNQPPNSESEIYETSENAESPLKKFMPVLYILPIVGVALLCIVRRKKKSNDVNT